MKWKARNLNVNVVKFAGFATTLVKWKDLYFNNPISLPRKFRDDIGEMERKFLLLNYRVADLFRDDIGEMESGN